MRTTLLPKPRLTYIQAFVILLAICSVNTLVLSSGTGQTIISFSGIIMQKDPKIVEALKKMGDELISVQNSDGGWTVHIPDAEYYNGSGGSDFMGISSGATALLFLWYGTNDSRYLDSAKKAFNFIVQNQNPDGGWGMPYDWLEWGRLHPAGSSYTVTTAETAIALLRARDILGINDYDAALVKVISYFDSVFYPPNTWAYSPPPFFTGTPHIYVYNIDAMTCAVLSHPFMLSKAPYEQDRISAALDNILENQTGPSSYYGWPYGQEDSTVDMYTVWVLWGLLEYNRHIDDPRIADAARKVLSTYNWCAGYFEGSPTFLNGDSEIVALLPFSSWTTAEQTYYRDNETARNSLFRTTVLPLVDAQGRITRNGLINSREAMGYLVLKLFWQ